jgi:tetratricopeptide (TPR) repeat protein
MAVKINKKELKEPDKMQLFFIGIRAFLEKHRSRIYIAAGVFFLAVLLSGGWFLYQLNYETSAGKIYSRVFEAVMKAGSPAGDTAAIKGYKDLIAQFPRSHAAITGYYRLGNLYLSRHEIDAASKAYEDFLQKAPAESDLLTLAYNGLGACYEIKKDFIKALESFEKATKTTTAPSFEALNFNNMGRIFEAMNNPLKAAEFYRKALGKTTDPLMTLYLKRKIATLG